MSKAPYFAHESSTIDEGSQIGDGTKIWHYCHISSDSVIGENCSFGQNCFVAGGVEIGDRVKVQNNVSLYAGVVAEDDVFLGPSAVLTNVINPRSHWPRRDEYKTTFLRRGATVGANATIVCGTTLGRYCFIGAGAVVAHDVPEFGLMVGVPARRIGWACQCGETGLNREDASEARCEVCGSEYVLEDGVLTWLNEPEAE
jgi:UDP-2-acetamido-3-amino-2,3-dideoxy-glucuronate N-acetyltransferase